MWTRLHAANEAMLTNKYNQHYYAICGPYEIYEEPQHDAAARNRERGEVPRCKRCLAIIAKREVTP